MSTDRASQEISDAIKTKDSVEPGSEDKAQGLFAEKVQTLETQLKEIKFSIFCVFRIQTMEHNQIKYKILISNSPSYNQ